MPLQNRVTPFGDIVAIPERGALFGNRGGRIHDPRTRLLTGRRFASRRWICCELSFKNRRRLVFGPGYTELFFLDEATALAAGHRPCFECRRADALRFQAAFARGNGLAAPPLADDMDIRLHAERLGPRGDVGSRRGLPDGVMLGHGQDAFLVLGQRLLHWTAGGYRCVVDLARSRQRRFRLLTPPSIVAALEAGYVARLHASALAPIEHRAASCER